MIFNILDNTKELWMTKYIIYEIFSSSGATLCKNPSDQTVTVIRFHAMPFIFMHTPHRNRKTILPIRYDYHMHIDIIKKTQKSKTKAILAREFLFYGTHYFFLV